ncbi:MAG: cell division protein ZapE, partial [Actinobacteria bacterium]|nr:cell division protein ZapE [Actinomycetota bacterium]
MSAPAHLCDRFPQLSPGELLAGFVPPPHFAGSRFDTYIADETEPSQAHALARLEAFAGDLVGPGSRGTKGNKKNHRPRRLRRKLPVAGRPGIYLDGGFGVGKTHLLAALW